MTTALRRGWGSPTGNPACKEIHINAEAISGSESRQDVYSRVTGKIIADVERSVRTWMKPWSSGKTDGRIVLPPRHNGVPYRGINGAHARYISMLVMSAGSLQRRALASVTF